MYWDTLLGDFFTSSCGHPGSLEHFIYSFGSYVWLQQHIDQSEDKLAKLNLLLLFQCNQFKLSFLHLSEKQPLLMKCDRLPVPCLCYVLKHAVWDKVILFGKKHVPT
jgi:hypothetical protein